MPAIILKIETAQAVNNLPFMLLECMKEELPGLVQWNSRYSGTEPKYRLMLEADQRSSAQDVVRVAWEICDLIQELTNTPAGAKIEVLNVSQGGLMPRP